MQHIPVVFCFDDNLVLPAGVAIHSLLYHTPKSVFYDIYILHDNKAKYPTSGYLDALYKVYDNFKIHYLNIGNEFVSAYETRGITTAAYYRLLIPDLLPQYAKIMYHDVDIIFQDDISELFNACDLSTSYVAGVISPAIFNTRIVDNRIKLGLDPRKYILSGNLILNAELMHKDGLVAKFKEEAKNKYEFQDQDVINIVCKGRIKTLPVTFCGTIGAYEMEANETNQDIYAQEDLKDLFKKGIVHYNGPKPWNSYCPNFDIWWSYYRSSVFFDSKFYFDFFNKKLNEYDRLSFKKRLKILGRYFFFGQKK